MTVTPGHRDPTNGNAAQARYSGVAITLHWLIALAVLINIAAGLYMSGLEDGSPVQYALLQLHQSVGLTVLVLSVVRVVWRLVHPVPPLPADMAPLLKWAAHGAHFLLYVLILALPLTGWIMVSSSLHPPPASYFGLFDWPHIWFLADLSHAAKGTVAEIFEETHETLAWIMIVLVPLHVAAALYHHFVRRDPVLVRMLPGD